MPCLATLSIRISSFIVWSDKVHFPFPIKGASLGAYLMETIQWSVGIAVGPALHSCRFGASLLMA